MFLSQGEAFCDHCWCCILYADLALFLLAPALYKSERAQTFTLLSNIKDLVKFRIGVYYCLIMQTNPYPDPNFYSNMYVNETACINKYTPVRNLSQDFFKQITK